MTGPGNTNRQEVVKVVIPGRLARVSDEIARVAAPGSCPPTSQPRVEMIREGEVLRAIDVVCGCGKRTRLLCVYDQ